VARVIAYSTIQGHNARSLNKQVINNSGDHHGVTSNSNPNAGLISQYTLHPSAIVIAPDNVEKFCPTTNISDVLVTQYAESDIEDAGLQIINIIGANELDVFDNVVNTINNKHHLSLSYDTIPADDMRTFDLLRSGDTAGIPKFGDKKIAQMLQKQQPRSLLDLSILVGMSRIGLEDLFDSYVMAKHNPTAIIYEHPIMEDILKETSGILVYREQILMILVKFAGYSFPKAGLFLRAMRAHTEQMKVQFHDDTIGIGLCDLAVASKISNLIVSYSPLVECKAVALSYACHYYKFAYLKAHYPVEFNVFDEYP
jgi:DNA polymerase III subunit alpha